jgi:type III pantothenate kinase
LYGGLAQLEGFVERLQQFAFPNEEPIVIATGGLSQLLEGKSQRISQVDPTLVLEGIRIASELIAEQSGAMLGIPAEESMQSTFKS